MAGKLNSLTDVLKRTLFFFEALPEAELAPYVHRKMLKDYSPEQVEERVRLCLSQHPCFYRQGDGLWRLNLEGDRENDSFYSLLLKRGQPVNLREYLKNVSVKKKKVKKLITEEAGLISDGRFLQLENGYWGLTEWEVEADQYSLKHLVIKAMQMHPGGLSLQQLYDVVSKWRPVEMPALQNILAKFPFFEKAGDGVWTYNAAARANYERLLKRFLAMVGRQKERWERERARWNKKVVTLSRQLSESTAAQKEAAAALAEKMELAGRNDYLLTQMAEKDLLLSLRKKEIMRYREHIGKLEAKANAILYQCRLWVKRAREGEEEIHRLKEMIGKNQNYQEGLFVKLQQYKEKERESKAKVAELKEQHAVKVAELQTEIVELKQRLERERAAFALEERRLKDEVADLAEELRKALKAEEEQQKALLMARQEALQAREEYKKLENRIKNPVIRLIMKITSFFNGTSGNRYDSFRA
ncbi:MAG: phage-shock protein [Firmicutes bacterium]|nr:phage-shock protein [Bacillota bacterium]